MTLTEGLQLIVALVSIFGGALSIGVGITRHKRTFIRLSGQMLIWTGSLVIMGYVTNAASLYTIPPKSAPMALPSAICFVVVGANLLVLSNLKPGTKL
jgi:hypothetical protein